MLSSLTALAAVAALALLSAAQVPCGGEFLETNGAFNSFSVQNHGPNFTEVTVSGLNSAVINSEKYLLYCTTAAPDGLALTTMGLPSNMKMFKVPVMSVGVAGTYTSSYVELGGEGSAIKVLENPKNVVSPCLQAMVANGSTVALDDNNATQYESITVAFRPYQHIAQPKDVWIPMSDDVDPLLKIEYIRVVSLFFGQAMKGQAVFNDIRNSYNVMANDMKGIPAANRKRIAWIKYDFSRKSWAIRNNPFTKGIITAAGGITFPLKGDIPDNQAISTEDIKTMILNSQLVIDETDLTGQSQSPSALWRSLTGFGPSDSVPVFDQKQVFALTKTLNEQGVSDYFYRVAARPDLLLKDVIQAQYRDYSPHYKFTFLDESFFYGTSPMDTPPESATMCPTSTYNVVEKAIPNASWFTGDPTPPAPPVGGGIYGGDGSSSGQGGGSKTGIIVAVVCVAAILGAGFAFAFFKWSKRAKEDRFIELEEEMNNEIPLH
ncbi:hypothetical protein BGZ67_006533 [Mortierella alpina]|nr:hypothetical protein BGZ67_006533 [Mortierella alpina]